MGPKKYRNQDTRTLTETQGKSSVLSPLKAERPDILARIVETKLEEIGLLQGREGELRDRAKGAPPPRSFQAALSRSDTVALIAEVKRRSPGAGEIRPGLDPVALAKEYEEAGASALSILTDRDYFGGTLVDLFAARERVSIPLLRKDFTLAPEQVWEARGGGADAILLIARILEDGPLQELRLLAEELGMTALVEVHDAQEMDRALASGAKVIGVNNRDLRTFTTRLETTLDLLAPVPDSVVLVSESGIRSQTDVAGLGAAGIDAILVGEALLKETEPGAKVRELSGFPKAARRHGSEGRP
jgi:indole-3-glycerol phosphate synthase